MFHDLLDQPRRELEALRAQCAAQEKRLEKLESMAVKFAEQEELISKQQTMHLAKNISCSKKNPNGTQYVFAIQFVNEGCPMYGGILDFGSYNCLLKNGLFVQGNLGQVSIHGLGDRVEIFMFQPPEFDDNDVNPTVRGRKASSLFKLLVETPFEFITGREPMKVYHKYVEGMNEQLHLKLPDAKFYIFK